jgi:hypothetical protein
VLAWLAEQHMRTGLALPLRVLWVHDTLLNAAMKTGRSLEVSLWGGLWSLRDSRGAAVLTLVPARENAADSPRHDLCSWRLHGVRFTPNVSYSP